MRIFKYTLTLITIFFYSFILLALEETKISIKGNTYVDNEIILSLIKDIKDLSKEELVNTISKKLLTIDITPELINNEDLNILYSNDNDYGGHFSKNGNSFVADILYKKFKKHGLIDKYLTFNNQFNKHG